jgi:hypothetical protein
LLEGGLKMRIKPVFWAKGHKTPCAQKELSKMARCYVVNLSVETRQRKDALEVLPVFATEN